MSTSIVARLAEATSILGVKRWGFLAQLLVDAAMAHPNRIAGSRDADWGLTFLAVVARADVHARRNAWQAIMLLPALPTILIPHLVEAVGVDALGAAPIGERDLVALARTGSPSMLAALARRRDLTAAVANLIVARGDRRTLIALVANVAAKLGASCLGVLTELAYSDRGLKMALVARADLPAATLERLWPFLSPDAKRTALTAAPNALAERLVKLMGEDIPASKSGPEKAISGHKPDLRVA